MLYEKYLDIQYIVCKMHLGLSNSGVNIPAAGAPGAI